MLLSPKRTVRVLERWRNEHHALTSDESGMSLVEILIAVFILGVAVIAIASTAAASLQSLRESRDRQQATQFASTVLEEIRGLPFSDIALDESTVSVTSFDGEDILATPGGKVTHTRTRGDHTATTYITVIPKSGTEVDDEELRATVLVTWEDVDGAHTVRQETRIAEATRGLPVPSFAVNPKSAHGTGVPGETICVDHELSNLGEQDGYSWQLFATNSSTGELEPATFVRGRSNLNGPDGSGETGSLTRDGFRVPTSANGKHWFAWGLMRIPSGSGDWIPMDEITGDERPDSHSKVLALAEADVRFCYTALNTAGEIEATDDSPTFSPRVYSAFDDTVNTGDDLSNALEVEPRIVFYLRQVDGNPKNMTAAAPDNTDESVDYDDPDDPVVPGLQLAGTTFDPTRWTANVGTLGFSTDSYPRDLSNTSVTFHVRTDDDAGKDLVFDLRLLLHRDGATDPEVLSAETVTASSVTTAWQPVDAALTLSSSPVSVGESDTLILEIGCGEDSEGPCHVHYDVTTLDSNLSGDFQ